MVGLKKKPLAEIFLKANQVARVLMINHLQVEKKPFFFCIMQLGKLQSKN